MFIEKIFNFIDYYHQTRIINYLKKFKIDYFVDVGAHKGEFLSYLLKLNYKKIYCFEPQDEIFEVLYKNNKKNKNIEFFKIGLSDKNLSLNFYINKLSSTSTFSKPKKTFFSKIKNFILNSKKSFIKKTSIETKTLDEIFLNKKLDNIFLKIDVEGFELNVLKGAKEMLSKKVKFILVEKHFFQLYESNLTNEVDLFLKSNKYKLVKKFTYPLLHFQDNLYEKNKD